MCRARSILSGRRSVPHYTDSESCGAPPSSSCPALFHSFFLSSFSVTIYVYPPPFEYPPTWNVNDAQLSAPMKLMKWISMSLKVMSTNQIITKNANKIITSLRSQMPNKCSNKNQSGWKKWGKHRWKHCSNTSTPNVKETERVKVRLTNRMKTRIFPQITLLHKYMYETGRNIEEKLMKNIPETS